MINKRRMINKFKQLVKIDSLSLREGKVMRYLICEMKALGLKPYFTGKPKNGEVANLIVDVPGRGKKSPCFLLNAHVDTVSPGKNIKPIEKGNFITSDGTTILGADDKSGVAAILEILTVLKKKKREHPPIQVVFTVAEEIGLIGANSLPKNILYADYGIVFDSGGVEDIVYKAPSQVNLTATVIGKSAHAGIHPEEGINAIKVASEAIAKMKFGRIDKETTANIGFIKGGKATNIIPDEVQIKGEARSHEPKKLKKQIGHMKGVLTKTCKKFGAKVKIETKLMYRSFEVKRSSKILRLALSALKRNKIKPKLKQTGGGSDANVFNGYGIPSVIMGSGMKNVHTTSEKLVIKDLIKGAAVVLDLICEAPRQSSGQV
ncbi:MAG: M20/M25/M40 family metallo-hydrolase [Candidatus Margulisiibacteriota bacterium]|nr:M20/M25/M40 family metallo-hydrolase [Candidatus Margulisiibacteriota bacterium]